MSKNLKIAVEIFAICLVTGLVFFLIYWFWNWSQFLIPVSAEALEKRDLSYVNFMAHDLAVRTIFEEREKEKFAKEEAERKRIFQENVARAEALLAKYNSPMQGYGEIIVRRAQECGGDFRILLGIAGNESGLGRIPYKLYNPYGYLDGVQYSGWSESLEYLSCRISERFIAPCSGDLVCIINKYGGPDTDKDKWVRSVTWFVNQV